MSMLRICEAPGCGTRTLGQFCVAHETLPSRRPRSHGSRGWRSASTTPHLGNTSPTATVSQPASVGAR
jgi:hypothetical protein